MSHTLQQLAELTQSRVKGENTLLVDSVAALNKAQAGQISFVSNPKYIKDLKNTQADAVILSPQLAENFTGNALINDDPYLTFARILDILYDEPARPAGVHASAVIGNGVKLHPSVHIAANVVIDEGCEIAANTVIEAACVIGKNSRIGRDCHLYPNVILYEDSHIGNNCIIHGNTVIGADGFGFAPQADKSWYKIKQVGNVQLGNDVELGASVTIDRAALGSTLIGSGVKLDDQVHVGHNVEIGEHTVVAANTVFAGSTVIGKRCQIGGACAISGHLTLVDDVVLTGRSMVIKSITTAGVYSSGVAADTNKNWRKNAARFRRLDELARKVSALEKTATTK